MFESKKYMVVSLRLIQLLATASFITGFLWAMSDWLLLSILVKAPVTPLSVLLMLYGTLGIALCEVSVRLINRRFLPHKQPQ